MATEVKKVTKVRKKPKKENLTPEQHLEIVNEYAKGSLSVEEIADKFGTSKHNVSLIATRFWTSLTNMKESRALLMSGESKDTRTALRKIQHSSQINQSFLDLLSPEDSPVLSDAESIYCWIYVHTGDAVLALTEAGLHKGLLKYKDGKEARDSHRKSLTIRSLYLHSKPNVSSYIKDLRERRYVDQDVTKARVQLELLDQLDQMKQYPTDNRKEILRTIELLGKTVGAFVERLEISEIDPSKALDRLIELAKEAEITTVTDHREIEA